MRSARIIDTLQSMENQLLDDVPLHAQLDYTALTRDARTLFNRLHASFGRDLLLKKPSDLTAAERAHVKQCLIGYKLEVRNYFYGLIRYLEQQHLPTFGETFGGNLRELAAIISPSQEASEAKQTPATSSSSYVGSDSMSNDPFDSFMHTQGLFDGFNNNDPNCLNVALSNEYCQGYLEAEILQAAAKATEATVQVVVHAAKEVSHEAISALQHTPDAIHAAAGVVKDAAQPLINAATDGYGAITHTVSNVASGCSGGQCECNCNCGECCGGCGEILGACCGLGGIGGGMGAGAAHKPDDKPTPPPPPSSFNNATAAANAAGATGVSASSGLQVQGPILTPIKYAVAGVYGLLLGPNLLTRAYNSISNIHNNYRVNNSIGKLSALLAGGAGGFGLGYYVPYGGPHTAFAASLFTSWGATRIAGCTANRSNQSTFGQRNPEKYMLLSTSIASLCKSIRDEKQSKSESKQTSEFKIAEGMQKLEQAIKQEKQNSLQTFRCTARGFAHRLWGTSYAKTERHQHLLKALKALQLPEPDINTVRAELKEAGGDSVQFDNLFTVQPNTRPAPAKTS